MGRLQTSNEQTYRAWLLALERGDSVAGFFTDDVLGIELPNLLFPRGAQRDCAALLAAHERGKQVVDEQRFEVSRVIAEGELLAVELQWSGRLLVPFGERPVGSTLRASIASIVSFRNGKIAEIRSYDCYEGPP